VWLIAMIPSLFVVGLMSAKGNSQPPAPLLVVGATYPLVLICGWTFLVYTVMGQRAGGNTPWPYVLWAYATVMSPLSYMASKESRGNENMQSAEGLGMLGATVAFIVLVVLDLADASMSARAWSMGWLAAGLGVVGVGVLGGLQSSRPRSSEAEEALGLLVELAEFYEPAAIDLVVERIRKLILSEPDEFAKIIRRGTPVRQWVFSAVANAAADLVESGQYHIYRGVLDPLGPGESLLEIFDEATDELCSLGAVDSEFAVRQKKGVRENLKEVG